MRVVGRRKVSDILNWLNEKKFKYTINTLLSNSLHGVYYLEIKDKEEEFITRVTWGVTT
jgi:hypothetical protein